jgi:hypothetical protein
VACSNCLSEQAKITRSNERQQQKQAKTLAKQKERAKVANSSIKQVSTKQASINSELSKIKQALVQDAPFCIACKESDSLTLSHCISRKHQRYVTDIRNVVLLCMDCHQLFEHDKKVFAAYYPLAWDEKLERVKALSSEHFEKLLNKVT